MVTIRVFDPPMCCSTGVCGPSVDPELARFAADLDWLAGQGVVVARHNLAQEPQAFVKEEVVKDALEQRGDSCLPIVLRDGEIISEAALPSREQLAEWAGLGVPTPSVFTTAVAELVAIGAAIASNCEPCFKFHFDKARKLGVSRDDMMLAVTTASSVKEAPARAMLELADKYLRPGSGAEQRDATANQGAGESEPSGCCGPSSAPAPKSSGCC